MSIECFATRMVQPINTTSTTKKIAKHHHWLDKGEGTAGKEFIYHIVFRKRNMGYAALLWSHFHMLAVTRLVNICSLTWKSAVVLVNSKYKDKYLFIDMEVCSCHSHILTHCSFKRENRICLSSFIQYIACYHAGCE